MTTSNLPTKEDADRFANLFRDLADGHLVDARLVANEPTITVEFWESDQRKEMVRLKVHAIPRVGESVVVNHGQRRQVESIKHLVGSSYHVIVVRLVLPNA